MRNTLDDSRINLADHLKQPWTPFGKHHRVFSQTDKDGGYTSVLKLCVSLKSLIGICENNER